MSVAEILATKGTDVITIERDATLMEVAQLLAKHGIGALIVMDGAQVCGIASERDLIRRLSSDGAGAMEDAIETCMTANVVSCKPGDTIDTLMTLMTDGRFRHLPVLDGDQLAGIISIGDVVKRKIEQAERDTEELKRYIAG